MGGIMDFLFGKGDKLKKVQQFSPEQQNMFKQVFSQLMGGGGGFQNAYNVLGQYLDPNSDVYKDMENQQVQQFEQYDMPMLEERYAGFGGGQGGALSSSGFGQAIGGARAGLRSNIQAQKMGMQRNAATDIFGLMQNAMNMQPFGYQRQQGNAGFLPQLIGQVGQGYAQGYGMGVGGR